MDIKDQQNALSIVEKPLDYDVTQSNTLVQMQYAEMPLSQQEKNLVAFAISRIVPGQTKLSPISFKISEYLKMIGMTDGSKNYQAVRDAAKHIRDVSIWLQRPNSDVKYTFSWFQTCELSENDTRLTLHLSKDLEEYLLNLSGEYNSYKLRMIVMLDGKYTKRMYELLNSYANLGQHTFGLENLKDLLAIEKSYDAFGNFRKKVLDPSVNQINAKTDLEVSYSLIKEAKKVSKICFFIQRKELFVDNSVGSNKESYEFFYKTLVDEEGLTKDIIESEYFSAIIRQLCGWDNYKSYFVASEQPIYINTVNVIPKMLTLKKPMHFQNIKATSDDIIELVNSRISLAMHDVMKCDYYNERGYLFDVVYEVVKRYKERLESRDDINNPIYYLRGILYNVLTENNEEITSAQEHPTYKQQIINACPDLRDFLAFYYADKNAKDEKNMVLDIKRMKSLLKNAGYDEDLLFELFLPQERDISLDNIKSISSKSKEDVKNLVNEFVNYQKN